MGARDVLYACPGMQGQCLAMDLTTGEMCRLPKHTVRNTSPHVFEGHPGDHVSEEARLYHEAMSERAQKVWAKRRENGTQLPLLAAVGLPG